MLPLRKTGRKACVFDMHRFKTRECGYGAKFLMNHTEFTAVSPFDCVDSNKLRQNEDIRRRSAGGMLQLFPNLDGMDGFFIAAAVKSGAEMRNAKSES